MLRGRHRVGLSVAALFVWRRPSNVAVTPFSHPVHRTGHADFPHPAALVAGQVDESEVPIKVQVGIGSALSPSNLSALYRIRVRFFRLSGQAVLRGRVHLSIRLCLIPFRIHSAIRGRQGCLEFGRRCRQVRLPYRIKKGRLAAPFKGRKNPIRGCMPARRGRRCRGLRVPVLPVHADPWSCRST